MCVTAHNAVEQRVRTGKMFRGSSSRRKNPQKCRGNDMGGVVTQKGAAIIFISAGIPVFAFRARIFGHRWRRKKMSPHPQEGAGAKRRARRCTGGAPQSFSGASCQRYATSFAASRRRAEASAQRARYAHEMVVVDF